jgi:uncharacterized membrane protein YraQ (UPF0718 family)
MNFIVDILTESVHLFVEAAVYILFGLLVAGMLRIFLSPQMVARHLGQGRFKSVFKAALLGIPIPLCSCGVLPAALSLKKQGANNGATAAFMISTPESGVDSIAITYALMDPIMTVARPVVAFITATLAGITENVFGSYANTKPQSPDLSCTVDGCCDGIDCPSDVHRHHHTFSEKFLWGIKYAFVEFWGDLAGWFLIGVLLAGFITSIIPNDFFTAYLGQGLPAMLLMLAIGIPLYICATASTPIAAAFVLKGVSPGAALVFLLAGPATNAASLTVMAGTLGKRTTAIYLTAIAVSAVVFGLLLEQIYHLLGVSAQAIVGQASEIIPAWAEITGGFILLLISVKPVVNRIKACFRPEPHHHLIHNEGGTGDKSLPQVSDCGST